MRSFLDRFGRDERGATAIEYGLIAALIACVVIAGATLAGGNVGRKFNAIATKVGATV